MKELSIEEKVKRSIEEKAKAYDEALERARKELQICGSSDCDAARQIFRFFPELKENEDERIRKAIICGMYALKNNQKKKTFADIPIDDCIAWLEKQGESYTKRDVDDAYLKGIADVKRKFDEKFSNKKKQGEQKPVDKVEPFDKYEGLTDFERTLADICIGWIGEELGWKQYIKDNADVLLKIAAKKFNSVQDVPF